jgi:exodeoxyribonuclease-3
MKLLVWNIRQGGGSQRPRIVECILSHHPDLIALIEFDPGRVASLAESLRSAGFSHQLSTTRHGLNYAVCVLSKTSIHTSPSGIPTLDDSGLYLEVGVRAHQFTLCVLHAPTQVPRMRAFLDAVVQAAAKNVLVPVIFVGDFNTGIGPADGPTGNFGGVDRFRAILATGFTDAWRHICGARREYTYTFPRTGQAYRIDHALASPSLLPRIRDCRYSHRERDDGVSDHSLLLVEIED